MFTRFFRLFHICRTFFMDTVIYSYIKLWYILAFLAVFLILYIFKRIYVLLWQICKEVNVQLTGLVSPIGRNKLP